MNPKTMKTLVWAAIGTLLIGMTVMSPVAGLALSLLSAVFSVFPAVFAVAWIRLAGILILVLSISFSVVTYPKYSAEMKAYRTKTNKAP